MFTLATWNVNSLKVRLPHVLAWLDQHQPDVIALQELKQVSEQFPHSEFEARGYNSLVLGQPTYNGVALLSKHAMTVPQYNLPHYPDAQQRVISATVQGLKLVNVYVPNGAMVDSDKYVYKLAWLQALQQYLTDLQTKDLPVIVMGDFNIAPSDLDVHDPAAWAGQVLVSPKERQAWQQLLDIGFIDAFRHLQPETQMFTWWDYRHVAFRRNHGLRIDHFLVSRQLSPHCLRCDVDKAPRAQERPSDHAPVTLALDWS